MKGARWASTNVVSLLPAENAKGFSKGFLALQWTCRGVSLIQGYFNIENSYQNILPVSFGIRIRNSLWAKNTMDLKLFGIFHVFVKRAGNQGVQRLSQVEIHLPVSWLFRRCPLSMPLVHSVSPQVKLIKAAVLLYTARAELNLRATARARREVYI